MEIKTTKSGTTFMVSLKGRLDTNTAPDLEQILSNEFETTDNLILDFTELEYVSSAGLRVLLLSQKNMNKKGTMTLKNVQPQVMEVFEITGFTDILTIE